MNTSTLTNRCHRSRAILRVAAFLASATLLCMNCRSATAQAQPSNKPPKPVEAQKASPANPQKELAVAELAHQIEAVESDLRKLQEQLGANDPAVLQAQKRAIEYLESRVRTISPGAPNENKKATIGESREAIAQAEAMQLQQMKQQLADREKQMAMLAQQVMEQRRQQPLPPLENGQLKVYSLTAVPPRAAAQTIESLFGSQVLRIAVDERSNSLIVYGQPESLAAADALLRRLDEQAAATTGGKSTKQSAAGAPRSVLLRVFWLADGLPEGVGQSPADFLPNSVLAATNKLGLEAPRLVTQTVNSIAIGKEDAVNFSTNVPAVLLGQPAHLNCDGRLKLVADDRVQLEMQVQVGGPAINCDLRGSVATPIGHYMVLGTANSVLTEGGSAVSGMGAGPGMMGPGGPGGGRFVPGRPGQGFRGRAGQDPEAPSPGEFGGPEGAAGGPEGAPMPGAAPGAGAQPPKPSFNTSRFAFVVQVIEAQSYPADQEKSGSKLPSPPR